MVYAPVFLEQFPLAGKTKSEKFRWRFRPYLLQALQPRRLAFYVPNWLSDRTKSRPTLWQPGSCLHDKPLTPQKFALSFRAFRG
jgi:hypothetical protein